MNCHSEDKPRHSRAKLYNKMKPLTEENDTDILNTLVIWLWHDKINQYMMSHHIQTVSEAAVWYISIVWASPNINLPMFSDYRTLFIQRRLKYRAQQVHVNSRAPLKAERHLAIKSYRHVQVSVHPNNLLSTLQAITKRCRMNTTPPDDTPILLLLIFYHQKY
jgi:hypothetical protein